MALLRRRAAIPIRDLFSESRREPPPKPPSRHSCARGVAAIAILLLVLSPVASAASVREDQRACHLGFLKTMKKGEQPHRTSDPDEQYCIGLAYWFQPSPLPRNPARAAQWYEAAAKQGHVGAMVALAYQYEKGHGVEADVRRAFDLYQRAAEHGSPGAMFNLYRLYTTGKGVRTDAQQAKTWLDKAAAGSIDAKKELMRTARGTYQRPGQDIESAAYAAFKKKDYATSARLYRQASDLGNMAATVALGQHYHQGLAVPKDDKEAARLFRVAAERGDPASQAQLGLAYENGEGVPENWEDMRSWCEKSARQFHPLGLNCVGRLFQFGMGLPMDRAKAIALFDKAADQDHRYARWFAYYLRKPQNCIGYRSEWEREKFFGMYLELKGIVFKTAKERTAWLRQRYNEMEAEVLRDWGKNAGGQVCTGAGGQWSGVSCYTPAGRPLHPTQERVR